MATWQKFNINDKVRVKLTDIGRSVYREHYAVLDSMLGKERRVIPEDAEGFSEWQLWRLMSIFGSRIRMGFDPPFETTIEFSQQS